MNFHPIAELFPLIEGDEFDALVLDIKLHGLIEPITTYQNLILDGRNRYNACIAAGVEPRYIEYTGDDPATLALSMNLKRRHLTPTQKAFIALGLIPFYEEAAKQRQRQGQTKLSDPKEAGNSRDFAAERVGVSSGYVEIAKEIQEESPELAAEARSGLIHMKAAQSKVKKKKRDAERTKLADEGRNVPESDRWHVWQGDINTWAAPQKYDFIITDPPYPKEYLSLYEVLAYRAKEWLKPGGLLVAMCGQSYLNEIYAAMSKHIEYYWTVAYLTPGQSASLWQKQVIPKWKPLLIFSNGPYAGKMFSDVYESGENDKDLHKWGQSESGMLSIIQGICLPGQSILDPFCGAGTTGVAALKHGCLFDGIDIDEESVNISKGRMK